MSLAEGAARLLVIRREFDVEIETLTPGEYAWLATLAAGRPLAPATEAAVAADADFDLAQTLRHYVRSATLVGFDLTNNPAQ